MTEDMPGANGLATRRAAVRQRFGALRWSALLLVPAIAAAATLAISAMREEATHAAQAQVQILRLDSTARRLAALEWRALEERRMSGALRRELRAIDADARRTFDALAVVDANGENPRRLWRAFAYPRGLLGHQLYLVEEGFFDMAAVYQSGRLAPAFDELHRTIESVADEEEGEAQTALRRADLGTAWSLGLAAALLVLVAVLNARFRARAAAARERELERLAADRERDSLHDPLTGLPNRRLFYQGLEIALSDCRIGSAPPLLALLLVDLDGFKELNDTLGHRAGDAVLRQVGPRLAQTVGAAATLARLGGDEFALLVPGAGPEEALCLAERVAAAVAHPFSFEDVALHLEASVGVAVHPYDGDDAETLIQRADVAMYQAKRGRTGCERYDAARDTHSRERLALLGGLGDAIGAGEIVLHYQPKLDLRTGEIPSVEALVRWEHPEHGLLAPGAFLPLVESTSLIRPLALHVLETAIAQCAVWHAEGLRVGVAVNLGAANVLDGRLPEDIAALLARHGVDPGWLQVEVTEGVIMADSARAAQVIDALVEVGVSVSLDDFGTGHSSLARLKTLNVHELKIDKSFVLGMAAHDADAAIVRLTIDLARSLDLRVVAEGVESDALRHRLAGYGCDLAQGFGVCRPQPPELLTPWLHEQAARPPFEVVLGSLASESGNGAAGADGFAGGPRTVRS